MLMGRNEAVLTRQILSLCRMWKPSTSKTLAFSLYSVSFFGGHFSLLFSLGSRSFLAPSGHISRDWCTTRDSRIIIITQSKMKWRPSHCHCGRTLQTTLPLINVLLLPFLKLYLLVLLPWFQNWTRRALFLLPRQNTARSDIFEFSIHFEVFLFRNEYSQYETATCQRQYSYT